MSEGDIQRAIQIAATTDGHRLLRNNNGALNDATGRLVRYGLGTGTSDLIGWTADGRFLAIECKSPGAYTSPDRLAAQQRFIDAVNAAGGRAGFATSVAEARAIWER